MPILYEVLTGTRQFPELNPVKRGEPKRPHDRIQSDPENVERGDNVCGRASRTTRRPNRTRRAMACRVACACGLRPRVGCCSRSLSRSRPASRNAPGRERLPRRPRPSDPPVGATPAAPDARPRAGRHSFQPCEKEIGGIECCTTFPDIQQDTRRSLHSKLFSPCGTAIAYPVRLSGGKELEASCPAARMRQHESARLDPIPG